MTSKDPFQPVLFQVLNKNKRVDMFSAGKNKIWRKKNPSTTLLQQSGKKFQEPMWIVLQKNRSVMMDKELPSHSKSFCTCSFERAPI